MWSLKVTLKEVYEPLLSECIYFQVIVGLRCNSPFQKGEGRQSPNVSHNCFWNHYWGQVSQLLANFYPAPSNQKLGQVMNEGQVPKLIPRMSLPILSSPCVRKKRDHAKRVQPVLPANVFQEMTKKQTGDCNFRSLLVKKINLGKPPPTKFCISLVFYFSYAGEMKRKVPCKDLGGKQVGVLWEM